MAGDKTERQKLKEKQIVKAQEMINEGAPDSAIARVLGLSPGTIKAWKVKGLLGPKGTKPEVNLKLPPLLVSDPKVVKQLQQVDAPGVFAKQTSEGYKDLWFKLKRYLDDVLSKSGEELKSKEVKDWVETLQKLGGHVEKYEAENKPAHTNDEQQMAQELRERNKKMRELYKRDADEDAS